MLPVDYKIVKYYLLLYLPPLQQERALRELGRGDQRGGAIPPMAPPPAPPAALGIHDRQRQVS